MMNIFAHNEMLNRHSSMAYVEGGRPLHLGLERKDDLNCCDRELPCDHKTLYFDDIHMETFFFQGQRTLVYFCFPLYIKDFYLFIYCI